MKIKIKFFLAITFLTTLPHVLQTDQTINDAIMQSDQNHCKEYWITIFIHGSFSLRPHLTVGNMLKMLRDTIEESVYYRSTEINRRDPFFYKNQAMAGLGLHKIDLHHLHNNAAAPIIAASFDEISRMNNPTVHNEYYTFGWSGLVSNKLRYLESAFLYQDLEKLLKKIQREHTCPIKIRLIGYSHGGNLALQLGALHMTKAVSDQFQIDELWMLGTPIQVETDYLINSPVFKKIYNFYSRADNVQTLDFFSFKRFFSRKKFSKRRNFKVPEKLTQVRIKITDYVERNNHPGKDFEFPTEDPNLLKKYYKETCFDPGHFELWFMGWTILTYRKTFPFYPLPTLTFLPIIVNLIEQHPQAPHDLVAHIHPSTNCIELMTYHMSKAKFYLHEQFIDQQLFKHLKYQAAQFMPNDYNLEIYNQKVYGALQIAEHEWNEIQKLIKQERKKQQPLPSTINLHHHKKTYRGHLA